MFIDKLNVFWNDQKVGFLFRKEFGKNDFDFRYSEDWKKNGWPISMSLPLDMDTKLEDVKRLYTIRNFFMNLLPTGTDRNHHARQVKIDPQDSLSVLGTMLKESASGLVFCIAETPPVAESMREIRAIPIEEYLEKRKKGLTQRSMRGVYGKGDIVAGAQDKICCIIDPLGNICIPETGSSLLSTHILKPLWSFADNEHFCLRFGETCGLNTIKSQVVKIGDEKMVALQRYDRLGGLRLHQEDFCQALGLPDYYMYESDSVGATLADICYLVHENLGVGSCEKIAELVLFNAVIGNKDAHAKNISILRGIDESWALAPFYDLNCSTVEDFSDSFALRIGGAKNIREITPESLFDMGIDCKISAEVLAGIANRLLEKCESNLEPHLRRMLDEWPESDGVFEKIGDHIKDNLAIIKPVVEEFCGLVEERKEEENTDDKEPLK